MINLIKFTFNLIYMLLLIFVVAFIYLKVKPAAKNEFKSGLKVRLMYAFFISLVSIRGV